MKPKRKRRASKPVILGTITADFPHSPYIVHDGNGEFIIYCDCGVCVGHAKRQKKRKANPMIITVWAP